MMMPQNIDFASHNLEFGVDIFGERCFEVAAKGLNLILYPYDVQTIFGLLPLNNIL